jgi:hypothetical protein
MRLSRGSVLFSCLGILGLVSALLPWSITNSTRAAAPKEPDPAALERTREMVKMLDDLYKTAVVSVTNRYVEEQATNPAAVMAKDVFDAMGKKGWHKARLIDATGKPKNKDNSAKTDFEKKAVKEINGGKAYFEEVAECDGKPVLRVATLVPSVLKQCAVCHGGKEGRVLGAIIYELQIK